MKRLSAKFAALFVFSFALALLPVRAQSSGEKKAASNQNQSRSNVSQTFQLPRTPIEQFTLKNGLRVILSEDRTVPVVSVAVYYDTGSRNERQGRTGFAHLFEHMMFQGSENVPKAAHFKYISKDGGTMKGTTSSERTNYFETLPANQLPLALWLESDRMRSLKVTQENLDNQRNAVQEEKRLRIDNQPYVPAFLRIDELIFKNPANSHSTIGSMEDLDAATVEDVREFFRIYYAPNNAVLSVVGDFDSKEARSLIEKYFGSIPSQPKPPAVDVSEPTEVAQRQENFYDRFAPLPAFILAWKIPPRRTPDFYAISLATALLAEGESSRLYQKLVKGEESVVQIQSNVDERRGPSAAFVFAIPKPGKEIAQIRQAIMNEIKKLATEGPSPAEMEKLKNNLLNDAVRARQSSLYRAQRLAEFALYDNDPNLFNTELERYLNVTAVQIKDAAARFLDTENRVMMEIVPGRGAEKPAATAQAPGVPSQPAAPAPQVPLRPPAQPSSSATAQEVAPSVKPADAQPAQPQQPADAPVQTEPGAEAKRP
ncbi:MAG: insulinase family protein [Pyrinomonadaceae bacterium]|nr:insulinase family protein [Pyrinomonadaceae bacterium]